MNTAALSVTEMIGIRSTLNMLLDEIDRSPEHAQRDRAELKSDIVDALQRLTHAIGPEAN